ncbi:MAG: hypothetical protein ABIT96_01555 [Ferruginibacter sp.]
MSACKFSIDFSGSAAEIMIKARKSIESQGGNLTGDENQGQFNVSVFGNTILGTYQVISQQLEIIIEEKPFLVPCSAIEGFLKSKLG